MDAVLQKASGKVGLGFVPCIYNNGDVLLSDARSECYASSVLEAEAKAILWAMNQARSRGYSEHIYFITNCEYVHRDYK